MSEGSGEMSGMTPGTRRWPEWASYATCGWALVFAVVHLYWALGGTVGLPKGFTVAMNPALFAIDVLAVPLCFIGALLALSFVRPWGWAFLGSRRGTESGALFLLYWRLATAVR